MRRARAAELQARAGRTLPIWRTSICLCCLEAVSGINNGQEKRRSGHAGWRLFFSPGPLVPYSSYVWDLGDYKMRVRDRTFITGRLSEGTF